MNQSSVDRSTPLSAQVMIVLSWVLIALVVAGSTAGLIAIIRGDLTDSLGQLIGVCAAGAGLTAVALAAAWVWNRRRLIPAMVIAIALSAVAWLLWSRLILEIGLRSGEDEAMTLFLASLMTVGAAGLTYTGLFACQTTKSVPLRMMKLGTVGLAWTIGAMFCVLTGIEAFAMWGWSWLMTVLGAIQVCIPLLVIGSIVTPLAIRSEARRRAAQHESVVARPKIKLDCPDCQAALECPSGPARCTACGFTMMIELEEPRCECGYLLYKLQGETCPECGQEIAAVNLQQSRSDPPPSERGVRGG